MVAGVQVHLAVPGTASIDYALPLPAERCHILLLYCILLFTKGWKTQVVSFRAQSLAPVTLYGVSGNS